MTVFKTPLTKVGPLLAISIVCSTQVKAMDRMPGEEPEKSAASRIVNPQPEAPPIVLPQPLAPLDPNNPDYDDDFPT